MEWIQWSSRLLFIAFILYAVATVLFTIAVSGMRKGRNVNRIAYGKYAFILAVIGFIAQMTYFILRWVGVGYAPVSNLYEYTTFFGMMMVLGFLVFGFVYTLVSILWGFSALVLFPGLENPDMATPALLASRHVPPLLGVLVMLGITAAAISTVDSILLTLSSMVSRDLVGTVLRHGSERALLLAGRAVIPVIALLAFLFARLRLDLIAVLSVASSAGLLVMVPAIIGAFFWRRGSAAGAVLSMATGAVVVLATQFGGYRPLGQWPGVWGLATAAFVFVAVSLATRPASDGAERFRAVLRAGGPSGQAPR